MGTQQDDNDDVRFARGMAGPYGKFDHEIKFHVDEPTFDLWLRLCASKDVTSSEMGRELVYLVTRGRTPAEIVGDDRRELLQRVGVVARAQG